MVHTHTAHTAQHNIQAASLLQATAWGGATINFPAWPQSLKEWVRKVAKSALSHCVQCKCLHLPPQPSVCATTSPLCFQFGSHAYFHLEPSTSCQCKSGRTLGPINTDVRKDSLPLPPSGLISDRSLLLQRGSGRVGEGADMNCKCENYWRACRANSKMYNSTFGIVWLLHNRVQWHDEHTWKINVIESLVCVVMHCSFGRELYCHCLLYHCQ